VAKKRPTHSPEPEQLVFPYQLRIGDIIEDEGARAEVIERPTVASGGGKMTRAWVRYEGGAKSEALWDTWRKIRVVRRSAA
jgi:hypothetical protein